MTGTATLTWAKWTAVLLSLAWALPGTPTGALAQAQTTVPAYQGADREQKLLEGARSEGGAVTVYSSFQAEDNSLLGQAFQKKYGIKVNLWRSASETVVQRMVTEYRAGRFEVDAVTMNGTDLVALHRESLLQPVRSPGLANLIAPALPPHGEWAAVCLNVFVQAYNTNLVRKEELPRSYADLLDPRWKGKLAAEPDDADWFASVAASLGEAEGARLFREIVAKNGISIRKGHGLLANLIGAGEIPLGLTVYSYNPFQMKRAGVPIEWFVIPPAIARTCGVAVTAKPAHPHAAALFFDFLIGEGQKVFAERDYVTTRKDIETPFRDTPLKVIDSAAVLDNLPRWQELYREVLGSRPR